MLTPSRHIGFHLKSLIPYPSLWRLCNRISHFLLSHPLFEPHYFLALWGLLLKSKDKIKTCFKWKKYWISFIKNVRTRRIFIARRDFRKCTKEQKIVALTHFFYFHIFIFRLIFRLWRHILKDSSPTLEHQEHQRTPIACIYSMYIFYGIQKFSAFYFTWVVVRQKEYDKRWCKYYSQLFQSRTRRLPQ